METLIKYGLPGWGKLAKIPPPHFGSLPADALIPPLPPPHILSTSHRPTLISSPASRPISSTHWQCVAGEKRGRFFTWRRMRLEAKGDGREIGKMPPQWNGGICSSWKFGPDILLENQITCRAEFRRSAFMSGRHYRLVLNHSMMKIRKEWIYLITRAASPVWTNHLIQGRTYCVPRGEYWLLVLTGSPRWIRIC